MPIRTSAKSNKWRPIALCLAMILINPPMISAGANQTETPGPWIVAAKIMRNEQDSATGVYLKPGLVVTAASDGQLDSQLKCAHCWNCLACEPCEAGRGRGG